MFIPSTPTNPATVTAKGHGNPTGIALRITRDYLWLAPTADLILDVGQPLLEGYQVRGFSYSTITH